MNLNRRSEGLNPKKPNRVRNIHYHMWVTGEEDNLIRDRMARMGVMGLSAYLRKMAIDGYFLNLDLSDVKEVVSLLRRCSNNLNQYAKKANETGSVYTTDIEDLRVRLDEIWGVANGILRELAGIQ